MKVYNPIEVEVDNEDSDDGFFSIGFIFNYDENTKPHNVGLCRDAIEDPTKIYIEADDQIYGFYTKNAQFFLDGSILNLKLLDQNIFYWDKSQTFFVELPIEKIEAIKQCLSSIFAVEESDS